MPHTVDLQKVCDIYDLFDPEIDQILRGELKSTPFGSRRAWEFAMIFRALQRKGKLTPTSEGLAMGAGTERLIYAIARHAGQVLVTDLYTPGSGWVGVRTDDPLALVLSKAPWPIEAGRIQAAAMDMRDLQCEDNAFDFAWSTGAFEHIGQDDDFAKHLREVHRVLKPGGVYAFTTAIVFGDKTLAIPHNYYFHPEHLLSLLHDSPLHAEPEFNCSVNPHLFNRPHFERFEDFGLAAASKLSKPIVSFRRGALLAANVMVLTKADDRQKVRPKVTGLQETTKRLLAERNVLAKDLWSRHQTLQTDLRGGELVVQPQWFGRARISIDILASLQRPQALAAVLRSRAIDEFADWRVELEKTVAANSRTRFEFESSEHRIYGLSFGQFTGADQGEIQVRARFARDEKQTDALTPAMGRSTSAIRTLARRLRSRVRSAIGQP